MNIAWTKTGFTSGTKDGNSSYGNSSLIGLKKIAVSEDKLIFNEMMMTSALY
jgi:hypothetical protein